VCVTYQLQRKKTKQDKKIGEIEKEDIDPELMCNKSIPQVTYKNKKKSIPQVVEGKQAAGLSHLEATTN